MQKIIRVWIDDNAVYIETNKGEIYNEHFSDYPRLQNANPSQRSNFEYDKWRYISPVIASLRSNPGALIWFWIASQARNDDGTCTDLILDCFASSQWRETCTDL